jgi:hypothetical protein
MAHITSYGAGIFSDLSVVNAPWAGAMPTATGAKAAFDALFPTAGTDFTRILDVREFPSIGDPANIVNVPVYGKKLSSQVSGQADAPNLEMTLNYIPNNWADGTTLGDMVGADELHAFRFTLLNGDPEVAGAVGWGSAPTDIGVVPNSMWYFVGKIASLLANPQLTDANTATLTLSIQSDFYGAYTV